MRVWNVIAGAMGIRRFLTFILLVPVASFSLAQVNGEWKERIDFVNHLLSVGEGNAAIEFLDSLLVQSPPTLVRDSLHLLAGWQHYQDKNLTKANFHFLNISPSSGQFPKARFFSSYNFAFQGHFEKAAEILETIPDDQGLFSDLKWFEKAGVALLRRDTGLFNQYAGNFGARYFAFAEEEQKLVRHAAAIREYRSRKPALAALFSAILPGAGKVYAGRTGEGISAFVVVTALSLVSLENYRKDGLRDYKTILFGTLAGVYYGGNVVGSYYAALQKNKDFDHAIDQHILFDIHIPLRTIFN